MTKQEEMASFFIYLVDIQQSPRDEGFSWVWRCRKLWRRSDIYCVELRQLMGDELFASFLFSQGRSLKLFFDGVFLIFSNSNQVNTPIESSGTKTPPYLIDDSMFQRKNVLLIL